MESDVAARIEAARLAGFQQGEQQGFERGSQAARPYIDKLTASVAEIGRARSVIRRDAERDLIALSLAIAKRILRRELAVDPDAVQGIVRAALDRLQSREITRVRVAPGQEEAVRRNLAAAQAPSVEVRPDPSLQPGDVVVETSRGNLDASIDTQLSEIERGFADRLR
jgi:flagellar assembly protein FliH